MTPQESAGTLISCWNNGNKSLVHEWVAAYRDDTRIAWPSNVLMPFPFQTQDYYDQIYKLLCEAIPEITI